MTLTIIVTIHIIRIYRYQLNASGCLLPSRVPTTITV